MQGGCPLQGVCARTGVGAQDYSVTTFLGLLGSCCEAHPTRGDAGEAWPRPYVSVTGAVRVVE